MDFQFLKLFILFYAYNKYSERHCGIYLRFTCIFFALFSCILRALEVMANEHLFADQYGNAAWSWNTDTNNKASAVANAISSFSFIITLLRAMKCLSVLKPPSVKRQKRDLDVYKAYTNSNNVTDDLQNIQEHQRHLNRVVRIGGHYHGKCRCTFHPAPDQSAAASQQCTSPDTIWLL